MASAFVFMPFLVRRFGLEDYGLFLLAGSLSGYLGLMDLGVGASVVKYVAEHRARGEDEELSRVLSTSFVFYVLVGLAAGLVLVLVAMAAPVIFRVPPQSVSLVRNLFLLSAAVSVVTWPAGLASFILAGHQRYDISSRVAIGATIGNILATTLVLVTGQGPFALLAATSVVGVLAASVNGSFALRELEGIPVRPSRAGIRTLRTIFRFSSVILVTQICGVLIYQQTDRVVLGVFVGASAIALYEGASRVHALVRQLASMMASAVMPMASKLDAERRDDALQSLYLRGTKYTVIFITPIVVSLIVLARPLLRAWLGDEFTAIAVAAQLLVSYWLLNANTTVSGSILTGTGRLRFLLWYTVSVAAANVLLSVVLVHYVGILGVVLGTVIPYYVGFPVYMRYMLRQLHVAPRTWWRDVVARTYPLLVLPALISFAGVQIGLTRSLLGVATAGLTSVGACWCAAYWLALIPSEREELRSALRARPPDATVETPQT
jgi:O-antigen/teichoic acid export membrane protein